MNKLILIVLLFVSCVNTPESETYKPNGVVVQNFDNINSAARFSANRTNQNEEVNILHVLSLTNRISSYVSSNNIGTWQEAQEWINLYLDSTLISGIHINEPIIPSRLEVFITREYFMNIINIFNKQSASPIIINRSIQSGAQTLIFTIIDSSYDRNSKYDSFTIIFI